MAETSNYQPPKHAVKPADNDTGYKMVKKAYRRFIWTWNEYAGKKPKINEDGSDAFRVNLGPISGMGRPDELPSDTVGYTGPLKNGKMVPTDDIEDPDKKDKKKRFTNLQGFDEFNK